MDEQRMTIEQAFSTEAGKKAAREVAKQILENERPSNYDECLDSIIAEVCKGFDRKIGMPVSLMTIADIKEKLNYSAKTKEKLYLVNKMEKYPNETA